ncbi:SusC/RagA family TonB-linked outer membrane protein [Chitinophaga lutea]
MKFIAFFSLVFCMTATAKSYAQKVSLTEQNVSLERVFSRIKKQTGYTFIYTLADLQKARKVSLSFSEAPLDIVMNAALSDQPLTWTLFNNMIIIKEKPAALPALLPIVEQSLAVAVSGRVTNEAGEPLIGASVHEKGTQNNAVCGTDGSFKLNVSGPGATLVISYIGYKTQEIVVGTQTSFAIRLQTANSELTDVVVVGYGTRKKVNLTGSLSVLDMKTVENRPITNASQALHGVSGLWVNQAGGKPGQDVGDIRIRGVGTFGAAGNSPLVLVDGVEYNLNELNPDFIDNITVLKDASAAIYGSRAANGVILVTTKQGRKGERAEVNYSFSYGTQEPTFLPDVVWDPIQYMTMKNQALINEGKSPSAVDYSDAQIQEYKNGMATNPWAYPNVNWFNLVMKNGYLQQHNLRISGGTDKVVYNIGLGFMDQDGILIDANHANRYSLNINVSAQVSKRLKMGASIVGNYRVYSEPPFGSPATKYYFNRLLRVLPIFTPYTQDGRYGSSVFQTPGRNTIENPLMLLKEGQNDHFVQRNLVKINADYKLPFDITYSATVGLDKLDGKAETFVPYLQTFHPITGVPNNYNVNPYSYNYDENRIGLSLYHTLNWQRKITGGHDVQAMLGSSYNSFRYSSFSGQTEGYFDNTLTDLDVGKLNQKALGSVTNDRLLSYFGRVNYTYRDKYLLEAVLRYDGSSRFAAGNRWGAFPSLSAGWRVDQEPFLKGIRKIDLLKVRASWGKLGNQDVPYFSYLPSVGLGYDYPFNNVLNPGAATTAYSDPSISWETTTSYNAGVDFSLWNGLLGGSIDVFKRRTSDILRPVNIPDQVGGLTGPRRNVGVMDNDGIDLVLSHRNKVGDFTYEVSGGVSHVRNKVVDLKGEVIISGRKIVKEGYALDSWYVYDAEGIYQTAEEVAGSAKVSNAVKPGYLRYRDVVKDGKIDGNDRVIMGSSIPKYTYSFNVNVGYKSVRLETFWQGVQGINHYPSFNLVAPFNNGAGVTKEWATDSWTPERRNARLPLLTTATGAPEIFSAANASSFFLQDGSFLRLKNIQLKYDVAKSLLSRINIQKASIFVNAENLVTFTKFRGFDPEKSVSSDAGSDDIYEYPTLKTMSLGLNVTF